MKRKTVRRREGLVPMRPTRTTPQTAEGVVRRVDNQWMKYSYWRSHLALFAAFMLTVRRSVFLEIGSAGAVGHQSDNALRRVTLLRSQPVFLRVGVQFAVVKAADVGSSAWLPIEGAA